MTRPWVPQPGDVVRLDDGAAAGGGSGAGVPALVLSHQRFNARTGLAVVVPCTSSIKGFPFEARVSGLPVPAVALTHQMRTVDWRDRNAVHVGSAAGDEMSEIREKIRQLLGL